jgi:hypothetical protein
MEGYYSGTRTQTKDQPGILTPDWGRLLAITDYVAVVIAIRQRRRNNLCFANPA